jgi:peptide methionine sulfoxide reductase msrA/msrB
MVAAAAIACLGWIAWQSWAGSPAAPAPKKEDVAVSEAAHCKRLTPDEERVIVNKGTERAFSGAFWDHHADGTYRCKRCSAELFPSTAKFDSGTGWPSFDDAVPGAVREIPDADGFRTEIVCAKCGGHLGHVFKGEGFTAKGVRHCVNSISLEFEPKATAPGGSPPSQAK